MCFLVYTTFPNIYLFFLHVFQIYILLITVFLLLESLQIYGLFYAIFEWRKTLGYPIADPFLRDGFHFSGSHSCTWKAFPEDFAFYFFYISLFAEQQHLESTGLPSFIIKPLCCNNGGKKVAFKSLVFLLDSSQVIHLHQEENSVKC